MGLRIGGITFSGISSGFPTDDIIEQLLELERRPIDLLEGRKESFEEKLAIFQDLNTRTLALRDALRNLDNMNLLGTDLSAFEEFRRFAATSTDSTIATATAGPAATPGSLLIEVQQLAAQEREISNGYSARTASVGTGTFSITVGTDPPTDITIDSSNETVDGFVEAVNSANAGVTAFVVDDGRHRLGILTDLGHVFDGLDRLVESLDAVLIESNYDPRMLARGSYPRSVKERIKGPGGHISNTEAAELLRPAARHNLQWACLAHLSEENNSPAVALRTHRDIVGAASPLHVASRHHPLGPLEL